MTTYIVTFYSHFAAIRFKTERGKEGIRCDLMPVPRFLSSSCGTCARVEMDIPVGSDPYDKGQVIPFPLGHTDEIEQVVELTGETTYITLYSELQ